MKGGWAPAVAGPRLSDGEVHYLWWFIQGSIMDPDIRWRLRRACGMCERHAWGGLAVEAAFRPNFLHGPALLYEDLLGRALRAFGSAGPRQGARVTRRLRATGPCLMCDVGLGPASHNGGAARKEMLEQGRDPSELRHFADRTREYWLDTVCGTCLGTGSSAHCRPHLLEEVEGAGVVDLVEHRAFVERTLKHLRAFAQSFRWEYRHTGTGEDRAALIVAVGWCSGWRAAIPLLGQVGT